MPRSSATSTVQSLFNLLVFARPRPVTGLASRSWPRRSSPPLPCLCALCAGFPFKSRGTEGVAGRCTVPMPQRRKYTHTHKKKGGDQRVRSPLQAHRRFFHRRHRRATQSIKLVERLELSRCRLLRSKASGDTSPANKSFADCCTLTYSTHTAGGRQAVGTLSCANRQYRSSSGSNTGIFCDIFCSKETRYRSKHESS